MSVSTSDSASTSDQYSSSVPNSPLPAVDTFGADAEKPKSKSRKRTQRTEDHDASRRLHRNAERTRYRSQKRRRLLADDRAHANDARSLTAAMRGGDGYPTICVDLAFVDDATDDKTQVVIAQQLTRIWARQKIAKRPANLHLTSLKTDSPFHAQCRRIADGFAHFKWNTHPYAVETQFDVRRIVYVCADKRVPPLTEVDMTGETVYVLPASIDGDAVCERAASMASVRKARLPISEHMRRTESGSGDLTLAVNLVFDALLNFVAHADWSAALASVLPSTSGFVPKTASVVDDRIMYGDSTFLSIFSE